MRVEYSFNMRLAEKRGTIDRSDSFAIRTQPWGIPF
jgi:hypothetical protein